MNRDQAEILLKRAVGDAGATFREGQWEAIDALVNKRGRQIVVERTGWGKWIYRTTRMDFRWVPAAGRPHQNSLDREVVHPVPGLLR